MGRFNKSMPGDDYSRGYKDGIMDSMEQNGLSAYYTGVGYGKRATNDKNLGFNSKKERDQFVEGVKHKDNHFNAVRVEPKSWLEKFIDTFDRSARKRRKYNRKIGRQAVKNLGDLTKVEKKKSTPSLSAGNTPRLAAPKQTKKRYRKRRNR